MHCAEQMQRGRQLVNERQNRVETLDRGTGLLREAAVCVCERVRVINELDMSREALHPHPLSL